MRFYPAMVSTFGALALVAGLLAALILGVLVWTRGRAELTVAAAGHERYLIGGALGIAFLATAGSLYLSDVAGLIPCRFCWYQRIAMYPLVPILAVAMVRGDPGAWRYSLPLSLIGLSISGYHVAIQWRPGLDVGACEQGVSCTARYVAVFGFVSIPTMAGAAFALISALLLALRRLESERSEPGPATSQVATQ